jgi:class 3 adenylate cyclase/GAF domain-containing protein
MNQQTSIDSIDIAVTLDELEKLCRSFDRVPSAQAVFPQVLETTGRICGEIQLQGYLYNKIRAMLEPCGGSSPKTLSSLAMPNHLFEILSGPKGRIADQPFELNNLSQSHPWWNFHELNREAIDSNRIVALYPLVSAREILGLVALDCGGLKKVSEAGSNNLLALACSQIALGLSHLSLVSTIRRTSFQSRLKALELETLQDVGVAFAGSLNIKQLTGDLLIRVISILNVNRAAVLLDNQPGRDNSTRAFRPAVVESFGLEELEETLVDSLACCPQASTNLLENSPTVINDPSLAGTLGCRNLMVVPIQYKGQLLGAILVGDKESRSEPEPTFGDDDLRLLGAMAGQAGAAISNARLYSDVLRMKNFNENILTSIASGVITVGADNRVDSFNDSATRIFALPPTSAVGMSFEKLLDQLGLSELAGKIAAVKNSGEHFQEMNVAASGPGDKQLTLNVSVTPLSTEQDVGNFEADSGVGLVISVENVSEGARVKDTLRRYVSANVADMVLEEGHKLVLGGKLCEVTVLFADIRGFTSLSERRSPQDIVELLNSYFDLIIDVVFRYNGTVDKIVGDEIMVLFGAPFPLADDTERAVRCAIEMLAELEKFNASGAENGQAPIRIGIGLNRGNVISGNIGSAKHMDYTVIGDAVNLASRLVDNAAPGQILLTRSVAVQLEDRFPCHRIGEITVKGKRDPVEIFEIASNKQ